MSLLHAPPSPSQHPPEHRLGGLVVKASAMRAGDPGVQTSPSVILLVATLPRAWRYRVGAWTGWPGVSKLSRDWVGQQAFTCSFCLSVATTQNCQSRSVAGVHVTCCRAVRRPRNNVWLLVRLLKVPATCLYIEGFRPEWCISTIYYA